MRNIYTKIKNILKNIQKNNLLRDIRENTQFKININNLTIVRVLLEQNSAN